MAKNYEQNKLDKVRLKLAYVGCKFYDSISRLYFPQNLLPWQPYDAFSCALKIGISIVLYSYLENGPVKSSQTSTLDITGMIKFCRAHDRKLLLFD